VPEMKKKGVTDFVSEIKRVGKFPDFEKLAQDPGILTQNIED